MVRRCLNAGTEPKAMNKDTIDAQKTREINLLVRENRELLAENDALRQRMASAHSVLIPLGQSANPNLAINEALRILKP